MKKIPKVPGRIDAPNVLAQALKDSGCRADQIAADCPAVTVAEAVELVWLAAQGRIYYDDQDNLVLNYGRKRPVKGGRRWPKKPAR